MQSYLDTRRTRPFESRLRAAVVASMSMCIDRRWLCAHLVSPGRVCGTGSRLEELMLAGTLRLLQTPVF